LKLSQSALLAVISDIQTQLTIIFLLRVYHKFTSFV
jgi:hypothetical protein